MSADWALEELGKIVTGKTPPKAIQNAYSQVGIPFITPKDMDGRKWILTTERYLSDEGVSSVQRYIVPAGSIAVSCIGSDMGKAARIAVDSVTNQQINTLIPDTDKCDPDYLYYLLSTMQQNLKNISGGSATPILNKGHFGKVKVTLPNVRYQNKAAKILATLDEKIQLNHQINQTLEQMAQAIFKSWFVDFEPVRAKMEAKKRWHALQSGNESASLVCYAGEPQPLPDLETCMNLAAMQAISGKTPEQLTRMEREQPDQYARLRATAELFPSAMQPSELGDIPEGWEVAYISDFGKVVCGKTPSKKKSEYYGTDIPFIKIPDMHGNVFVTKTSECLSIEGGESQPKKAVPAGSVCVSCIATVGQVVITSEISHTNQQINSIVPIKQTYTPYLYFRMKSLYKLLHDLASGGSATLNLNTGNFSKIQIIKPADLILDVYQQYAYPLLNTIRENMHENHVLSYLRDTLLPKLLSGEITVPEAEAQLAKTAEVQA